MFKLMGLLVGLAAIAATSTSSSRNATAALSNNPDKPPVYAVRDALGALTQARP